MDDLWILNEEMTCQLISILVDSFVDAMVFQLDSILVGWSMLKSAISFNFLGDVPSSSEGCVDSNKSTDKL